MDAYRERKDTVKTLATMGHSVGCVVRFVRLFQNFMSLNQDYGIPERVSVTEMTTLVDILENPQTTAAGLTRKWRKTKGAVSQILKKLEEKGLIYKVRNEKNAKEFHLFPTEKGRQVVDTYYSVDTGASPYILNTLLEDFTPQEIHSFYSVMDRYSEILTNILSQENQAEKESC